MNKNWAGSNGVITLLAFMASAALLLSAYSFYTFRKQNLNLNNTVTLDAGSSQLKVWNGNEWQNIGGAQPGQVLGIIDGKPGWIETSGSSSDSFANTTFGAGLVRTGDKTAYTLSLANCNSGQVLQATGSAWECATITNPTPTPAPTFSAGNGINISGSNVISSVLGNSISSGELEPGAVTNANLANDSVSSANIINGTILLADLNDNGCNIGQIFKYDGSNWVCAADNAGAGSYMFTIGDGTNTQIIDNTDLLRFNSGGSIAVTVGATDTVTLDVANNAITGAKILDGSIGFADFSGNGCANGQIIKFNGSAWVCGTDNVNDADSSVTNELQNLSLAVNVLSLSGSAATVNLAPYLDNTDAQAISKTGNTLSISGNASTINLASYLDNTDVLASLACANSQIVRYNGSAWICSNDTDTTYSAGTGVNLVGTTFSTTLGTSVDSSEIVNGSILFADIASNSCANGEIFKFNGSAWVCGSDNVNDADSSVTNELQNLSLGANILSLSGSAATINLAPYLDNTDSQNLSYVAGTQTLSIGGGNSVSLASLLDNTDSQGISKTGNTLSISGNASTVDLSGYLDNTDVLASLACANGQVAQWNGSAWICANAGADTDDQTLSLITNTLSISEGNSVSLAGYLDNTDAQAISRSGDIISITGNAGTVDLSPYLDNTDSQTVTYTPATQVLSISGGNTANLSSLLDNTDAQSISKTGNSLSITGSAGTVDLSGYLDNTDVLGSLSCSNTQIAKYNGSAWVCAADNDTDAQTLSLISNTLSVSNGNSVSLAGYLDNTDAQAISKTGNVLNISGNASTVDLSSYLDNTDSQNLSYVAGTQTLSIGGGNSVSLATLLDNTDSQAISKSGNIISITGSAGTVDLSGYLDNTDAQSISKTGDILSITGSAGTVDLSGYLDNTDVLAGLSCSNTQIAKYNGSAWVCATDNVNDADASATNELQDLSLSVNVLSLSSSAATVNLAPYLDNTDSQAISKTGNTLSISGNAGTVDLSSYLDNTDVLGSLSCSNTQIAKYNGSAWVCAADNDTDTTYSAGTGINLAGTTFSATLGTSIDSSEIVDGSILFADLSANSCTNGQIFKYNGSAWACGADNVNDADASATNELQDLSLSVNILSLSNSAATIDLSPYLDNTDSQNLSYVAGTQTLSIGGGNSVSLASLLDNTDAQAISKTGNTLSISGNASTVDLSGYLDNTDVLGSLSCSNTQIAKYNGSAWICAADNDTDAQTLSLITNTLSISGGNSVSLAGYLDNTDAQAISRSGDTISITGNAGTVDLSPYLDNTDSQNLSYVAGTQTLSIGGGNSVSLSTLLDNTDSQAISKTGDTLSITGSAGTVDLSGYLDNTDAQSISKTGNTLSITGSAGTVDLSGYLDNTDVLAGLSCGTNQIAKYNGSAWVCAADNDTTYSAGTGISIGATVISATLGTDIDSSEIVNGTIADADIANATITNSKLANSSVTVTAGTGLTGGGAVSLGGTVTLNSSLGTTIDTSEITDGTILFGDFASNGCGTNAIIKYNGSAWACGTDLTGGTVNSFETISTTGGTSPVADSSTDTLTLTAGTGVTVVGDGTTDTVTFAAVLGVDIDSSEIVNGTITNADIAAGTISNANLANSSVTVTAGTGLTGGGSVSLGGTVTLNSSLGTDIDSSEIVNGTIVAADVAGNIFAELGRGTAQTDGSTNSTIFINKTSTGNLTQLQQSGVDKFVVSNAGILTTASVNSASIVDGTVANTDLANSSVTVTAGTGLTGGGAVSLGGTVTLNSSLGTAIDSTEITDGTLLFADIATNGCGTNDIFKYNGSAWFCGTDVDTDTTYSAGTGISFGGTVISSTLGTDIASSEIVDGTITSTDVAANTFAQLGVAAAQTDSSTNGLLFINKTGASGNLLQLQVAGVNKFLVAFDGTIDTASVDSASIVDGSIANGDLANSSLTITAGTGLTGGGAVSLGGTVTLNNAFGTSIDNTEVTADSLDFTEIKDTLALDATTTIAAGASNFVLNLDGTGDFLVQDNGTTVLSVLDDGTFLFKNSTDGATAFDIQDSSGVDMFVIDTTNDRIYIGDPTADSVGALLVLDTKNSSGDPTGVNGAMYYNSNIGKFRCFENSEWRDCLTSSRTGYFYRNEMMGATTDNELAWAVTGAGAANSATAITSVAGRPGVLQHATGTTATGNARGISGNTNGILLGNSSLFGFEAPVRITTLSTGTERFSYRAGFIDSGTAESVDGCFFRYSDATNTGKWEGVCRNNNAESVCDTGITVAAATWYRLNVTVNAAGTNANFATDGTSRCNVTTNIPTGAGRGTSMGTMMLKSIGTTTRTINIDYIEVRAELPVR